MIGTAPYTDVFVLVELPGQWDSHFLSDESTLDSEVREWLNSCIERGLEQKLVVRTYLIKQRSTSRDKVRLFVCDDAGLRSTELDSLAEVIKIDVFGDAFEPVSERQYFVCIHGTRDTCCSKFGLPLLTELHELGGTNVWGISHLGGHRFAGNVLVLPDRMLYGQVRRDFAKIFYNTIEAGVVPELFLRGRMNIQPFAQAAEKLLNGSFRKYIGLENDEVTFETTHGREVVQLPKRKSTLLLASCRDSQPKPVNYFARTA